MKALDEPLGFGVAGLAHDHLGGHRSAKRLTGRSQLGHPRPPPPDRALTIPDEHPRHPRNTERCCHQAAYKSWALRLGISSAEAHREYPQTIVSTGSAVAVRV